MRQQPAHMRRDGPELRELIQARTRSWRESALARGLTRRAVRRARIQTLVLLPLLAAGLCVYSRREQLVGGEWDAALRIATAVVLVALGWHLGRAVGRAFGPWLF